MTYSLDIRQLALNKLSKGSSIRNVANELQISPQTIQNWKKNIEPKVYSRKPSKIDDDLLRKDVEMYPDSYQYERAQRFNCTDRAISKALKRLGITQKKESQSP